MEQPTRQLTDLEKLHNRHFSIEDRWEIVKKELSFVFSDQQCYCELDWIATDTNTVVKDAMKMAKIDNYIQEHVFPTKFVVFINPGQVFFCLMTYNTFYHLYNSKPIMSEDIELTRNPWNLSIYRRKDLDILAKKEGVAVGRHYISTMKKNLKSFSHHGATNYIIPEKEIHDRHTYHEWMFEY